MLLDAKVGDTRTYTVPNGNTVEVTRWSARALPPLAQPPRSLPAAFRGSIVDLTSSTVSLLLCRLRGGHRRLDRLNRLAHSSAAFRGGIVDSTSSRAALTVERLPAIADQIGDVLDAHRRDEPDRPAPRAASPPSARASSQLKV